MKRYAHVGRLYDLVSVEPLLYRRPRQRLGELLGPIPGATVVDVGCGTFTEYASASRRFAALKGVSPNRRSTCKRWAGKGQGS